MSNIPSSAMPHAWAHDEEDQAQEQRSERASPSLSSIAIAGGVGALLLYWMLRK
jgi:hypothetical protein